MRNSTLPATVASIMSEKPVCLDRDERLDIARALMVSCGIRHLPVEKMGQLVGVVSSHDLIGVPLLRETLVREVMSSPVVSISPSTPTESTLHLLMASRLSCLPVVDREQIVGIVTLSDFVDCAVELLERSDDPRVSFLMTHRPIVTVEVDESLDLAILLMKTKHVRHLPVMRGEEVVGILSDHDVIRTLGQPERETSLERIQRARQVCVGEVMSSNVVSVAPDQSAADAGRLLRRRRVGAAPVLSARRLTGMLTVCDYFQYLASMEPTA